MKKLLFIFAVVLTVLGVQESFAQTQPPNCIPPVSGFSPTAPTEAGVVVKDVAYYLCNSGAETHFIQGYEPTTGGGTKPSQSYYRITGTYDGSTFTTTFTQYAMPYSTWNAARSLFENQVNSGMGFKMTESEDWDQLVGKDVRKKKRQYWRKIIKERNANKPFNPTLHIERNPFYQHRNGN